MNIVICNTEIEYQIQSDVYLFNARALIKLIWKSHSYYYNKWLRLENTTLQDIGEDDKYCTLDALYDFYENNTPNESGKAPTSDEFYKNGFNELDKLVYPEPEVEMVTKDDYITLEDKYKELELLNTDNIDKYNKLKIKYDNLVEKSKKKSTLKDLLSHPELPLWAQLTTTIVLTFFTWTVFSHYFDFGSFSEYKSFHGFITLFAAIAFEFGLLIFTVRRNTKWLNISLGFQFVILGIHSGLLEFNYSSFEDFAIKLVLTLLLPITNKAFASTVFKK